METRYTIGTNEYKRMTTDELRDAFLVDLFETGKLNLLYCEVERAITGAVVPTIGSLKLEAGQELAADTFCQRREVGVLNIGAAGSVIGAPKFRSLRDDTRSRTITYNSSRTRRRVDSFVTCHGCSAGKF